MEGPVQVESVPRVVHESFGPGCGKLSRSGAAGAGRSHTPRKARAAMFPTVLNPWVSKQWVGKPLSGSAQVYLNKEPCKCWVLIDTWHLEGSMRHVPAAA